MIIYCDYDDRTWINGQAVLFLNRCKLCTWKAASSPAAPASVPVWMAPCGRFPWSSSKGLRRRCDVIPNDSNVWKYQAVPRLLLFDGLEFFFFHHGFTTSFRHFKIGIVEILCHLESTSTNHQRPVVQLAPCRSQTWPSSAQWWVPAQQALDGGSMEHNSSKFYSFFGYDEILGI
jgi:hypothetical protein